MEEHSPGVVEPFKQDMRFRAQIGSITDYCTSCLTRGTCLMCVCLLSACIRDNAHSPGIFCLVRMAVTYLHMIITTAMSDKGKD